jgi:hypothetical protein
VQLAVASVHSEGPTEGCYGFDGLAEAAPRLRHRAGSLVVRTRDRPLLRRTNHVLLAVIVLLADDPIEQGIRPFEHGFGCSDHSV